MLQDVELAKIAHGFFQLEGERCEAVVAAGGEVGGRLDDVKNFFFSDKIMKKHSLALRKTDLEELRVMRDVLLLCGVSPQVGTVASGVGVEVDLDLEEAARMANR